MGMSEKFVYDSTGNIIQLDDIVLEYSPGDRLQRRGNTQYIYDGNGRLAKKIEDCESQTPKVWEFGWDAEDQLRKVITPTSEIWEYKYDALGRRIVKQGPKTITRLVWNGDVIVHQVENKKVLHSSWVFDPHSFAPLCKVQNELLYPVICDHLGTPRELLDVEGKIVWSVSYKAWGEIEEVKVGEVDCPIRFQGQWVDEESGLYYNRFRYYEPTIGRFLSEDPIRLLTGKNLYRYTLNPIGWIDPFGLSNRVCGGPGSNDSKFRKHVEEAVIEELASRWQDPSVESWELIDLIGPHQMTNLESTIGPNQVRYQARFQDYNDNFYDISVNYDVETGNFGIIKPASGR